MSWATYGSFLGFAAILVVIPGPDFAVVTRNALAGGHRRGLACALGVASANALQGAIAAAGLGAVIVHLHRVFETLKWAGIAYLVVLAMQAYRAAWHGRSASSPDDSWESVPRAWRGWRQGFLSNITNPKVLAFYLAVLPQFLGVHATVAALAAYALSLAALSLPYLALVAVVVDRTRRILSRRAVRQCLNAATGTALLGFAAKLTLERT